MDENMPKNWINCLLEDVILRITNGSSAKQYNEKVGYPITRIETIWNEKIDLHRVKYVKEHENEFVEKYSLKKYDILLSHINSDSHLGKTAIFKNETENLIHGINLLLIRSSSILNADFLNYQFKYLKFKGVFIDVAQRAVNQSSINQRKLKAFNIKLPPFPEQRSIVSKIEQLFSDLDNGIDNFKKAQEQLKIYRQAVLKKAFEGEFTKKWREEQTDLPSAEELLQHVKEEREKPYQKQLDEWEQAVKDWEDEGNEGKKPTKPKKPKELPPLTEDELMELSELPERWGYIKFGHIYSYSPQNGLYKPLDLYGSGTSIIRIDDFYDGKLIRYKNFKLVKLTKGEVEKYSLRKGQILVNRVNSIDYLGKCGLVEKIENNVVFESNIMKISILEKIVNPKFITYFLSSYLGTKEIRKNAKHAVNQASINQNDVSITNIPFCNIQEQHQIIKIIEARLSICDNIEGNIEKSLQKAESLHQSILKKAFEGKLLNEKELEEARNAPDWEPAEKLLEKIKAQKNN